MKARHRCLCKSNGPPEPPSSEPGVMLLSQMPQKQRPTRTTYSSELGEIPLGGVMLLSQMQMPPSLCSLPSIWYIFALETICDVDEKDTFLQLLPIPAVSSKWRGQRHALLLQWPCPCSVGLNKSICWENLGQRWRKYCKSTATVQDPGSW